jgi:hypothetical protein
MKQQKGMASAPAPKNKVETPTHLDVVNEAASG